MTRYVLIWVGWGGETLGRCQQLEYVSSNGRTNDELEVIWKEALMASRTMNMQSACLTSVDISLGVSKARVT
jgi:hypothetical protein